MSSLYFTLKLLISRAKNTFSEALLPSQDIDRSDGPKSLLEKFYDKFANTPAPEVAAQLRALEEFQFTEPELHQFTEVRESQTSIK